MSSSDLQFVVCVANGGYVDLVPGKVYKVRKDAKARQHKLLRVFDESGEDYLYPVAYFRSINAPKGLFKLIKTTSE